MFLSYYSYYGSFTTSAEAQTTVLITKVGFYESCLPLWHMQCLGRCITGTSPMLWVTCLRPTCCIVGMHIGSGADHWWLWEPSNTPTNSRNGNKEELHLAYFFMYQNHVYSELLSALLRYPTLCYGVNVFLLCIVMLWYAMCVVS